MYRVALCQIMHGQHWSSSGSVFLRSSEGEILVEKSTLRNLASVAGDRKETKQGMTKHKDLRHQPELQEQIFHCQELKQPQHHKEHLLNQHVESCWTISYLWSLEQEKMFSRKLQNQYEGKGRLLSVILWYKHSMPIQHI